jgi:hypothetical protein
MPIKPGINVEVSFERAAGKHAPLGALVYAVDGERIVLSQTSPEILPGLAGQKVQISLVSTEGDLAKRFGFSALIAGFVEEYSLASGEKVPAVLVDRQTEPLEMNLRRNVRVRPGKDSGVGLMIYKNGYEIVDLSLMGLSFSQPLREKALNPEEKLPLRLSLDGKVHALRAKVVRVSTRAHARIVAMAFLELKQETEDLLWKTIFAIDRENLSRRKHV